MRLADCLGAVIDGIISQPSAQIGDLAILDTANLEQIWQWNAVVPSTVERCVHELIQDQVRVQPDAMAVSAWDGSLTYGELDQLSTNVARRLISLGVEANVLVPLCFEKSMWTTVAVLGVLKAGGAFILLDPALPEQRLEVIVGQVNAKVILSSIVNQPLCSCLAENVLVIDADLAKESFLTHTWSIPSLDPSSLMYVVFTSGSTGVPKGVMITHKNFVSALYHQSNILGFTSDTRSFDFTSYSFDVHISNVMMTLTTGGCLYVPSDSDRRDNLAASLSSSQSTVAHLTPSVARLQDPYRSGDLQTIILAGEAVHLGDIKPWWGKVKMVNAYGPSECTPLSTINYAASTAEEAVGIGRGVGLVTWIVDINDGCLLPPGCIGELLLEGPLVGPGYLNNGEATDAAFVKDPPWLVHGTPSHPGRRGTVYKTGDLVKYREDGSLLFIGRKDEQVKIRGQRVELGEVEHHLKEIIPSADEVVAEVIVPEGESRNPMLVAFLVIQNASDSTHAIKQSSAGDGVLSLLEMTTAIAERLSECLPAYMIPSLLFSIHELPMTATGKTDRRRLRTLGASFSTQQITEMMHAASGSSKRQPTNKTEQLLQTIWARVLNIRPSLIGLDDSFLQLGGDSITAMQVSSTARANAIDISTADVLRRKTIGFLTEGLRSVGLITVSPTSAVAQHSKPSNGPSQLSPMQRLYAQLQSDLTASFDQHFFLRMNRIIHNDEVKNALTIIIQRHSILRARFHMGDNGCWQQRITSDISGSFVLLDATSSTLEASKIIIQCRDSLDIHNGPLVAAALITYDGHPSLFLAIHHLVVDLVSWRVLLQELEQLLVSGTIASVTKSVDFFHWIDLQAQYATTHAAPSTISVPTPQIDYWDMQDRSNVYGDTDSYPFVLDEITTSLLFGGSCNNVFGTRPIELLLAALLYSFGKTFDDRDIPPVFMEGHGREPWDNDIDISSTVGWFTTMFPVHVAVNMDNELLAIIRRTKDAMRDISQKGWSYFTSRFMDENFTENFHTATFPTEILFNYMGLYQQLERDDALFQEIAMPVNSDPASSHSIRRFSLIEVNSKIEKGSLTGLVTYHKAMRHQEKIARWAEEYCKTLVILTEILPQTKSRLTLGDFPLAFDSYDSLDNFQDRWLDRLGVQVGDVEDIFHCSPIQEGILMAQSKDSTIYHPWSLIKLSPSAQYDAINLDRLLQAWREVIRRHSLLRAVFVDQFSSSGSMMQVILKDPEPVISILGPEDESLIHVGSGKSNPAYKEYGLRHHLSVCVLDSGHAYLRLEMDHAIMDGYSRTLLWNDFRVAYGQSGNTSETGGYRRFVQHLEELPPDAGIQFWGLHLAGVEPCFLPSTASNDRSQNNSPELHVKVPGIDTASIRAFCKEWEVTAATVVQVAWALVLSRFAGTETPCFGNLSSGRDVPIEQADRIFGPMIAMMPCRVVLDRSQTVLDTLQSIQGDYLASLPHQHTQLAAIHRALGLGTTALFNTVVSFQRTGEADQQDIGGLCLHYIDGHDPTEVRKFNSLFIRATIRGTNILASMM
jgi:amino acid adenylation domain-containing protein/non-ribosomal peptide synthase protein (TIGR01720 family)